MQNRVNLPFAEPSSSYSCQAFPSYVVLMLFIMITVAEDLLKSNTEQGRAANISL